MLDPAVEFILVIIIILIVIRITKNSNLMYKDRVCSTRASDVTENGPADTKFLKENSKAHFQKRLIGAKDAKLLYYFCGHRDS